MKVTEVKKINHFRIRKLLVRKTHTLGEDTMRCTNCNTELLEGQTECSKCGQKAETKKPLKENIKISTKALSSKGEMSFGDSDIFYSLYPMSVIGQVLSKSLSGFKTIFKNKKRLILILILVVIWVLLILLPFLGFNPLPVKIVSFLTFAQGAASDNPIRFIGGLFGKGVFAIFFVTLFDGGFKSMINGFKPFIQGIKNIKKNQLSYLLIGIGVASILYNFFAGYAALIKGMVGVSAILLILSALSTQTGFLYKLMVAVTAKRHQNHKSANEHGAKSLMSGLVIGFSLGIILSIIPIGYAPYLAGLFFLAIGIILLFVLKQNEVSL